jgi:hypothetical protein
LSSLAPCGGGISLWFRGGYRPWLPSNDKSRTKKRLEKMDAEYLSHLSRCWCPCSAVGPTQQAFFTPQRKKLYFHFAGTYKKNSVSKSKNFLRKKSKRIYNFREGEKRRNRNQNRNIWGKWISERPKGRKKTTEGNGKVVAGSWC